jgi:hypothetical protein
MEVITLKNGKQISQDEFFRLMNEGLQWQIKEGFTNCVPGLKVERTDGGEGVGYELTLNEVSVDPVKAAPILAAARASFDN